MLPILPLRADAESHDEKGVDVQGEDFAHATLAYLSLLSQ
jgi:hypothetical protein